MLALICGLQQQGGMPSSIVQYWTGSPYSKNKGVTNYEMSMFSSGLRYCNTDINGTSAIQLFYQHDDLFGDFVIL